jgi:hypothetical protein
MSPERSDSGHGRDPGVVIDHIGGIVEILRVNSPAGGVVPPGAAGASRTEARRGAERAGAAPFPYHGFAHGAHNHHDANYLTFYCVRGFRGLTYGTTVF